MDYRPQQSTRRILSNFRSHPPRLDHSNQRVSGKPAAVHIREWGITWTVHNLTAGREICCNAGFDVMLRRSSRNRSRAEYEAGVLKPIRQLGNHLFDVVIERNIKNAVRIGRHLQMPSFQNGYVRPADSGE